MKLWRIALSLAAVTGVPSSASAAWHEASTTHFVIYADENPDKLREFATKLEKFDSAVRYARAMQDIPPGPGNRLTIFVVANVGEIEKLVQRKGENIAGFYQGRATGSIAFVPRRVGSGAKTDLDTDIVFFHEYAHHLMMQELDRPYPAWLVEGFAEFMSTAFFPKDGSVGLGAPALHRAHSLLSQVQIPLERMLAGNYGKLDTDQHASLYSRGWLLTHYLNFEPSRRGQLSTYLSGIARGDDPLAVARSSFGDLKTLERNLDAYLNRRKMTYLPVSAARLKIGMINVRPLSLGAAAIIPLRMRSKRGVNRQTASPLANQIRAIAVKYPQDPFAQVTLAEAEYDATNYGAAGAAADRALAAEPKHAEAMIYKGRVAMELAEKSGKDGDWKEARRWLMAANKIDTEDPEPLMLFYQSYLRQGEAPTANAIAALHYSSRLSPQDLGLRMNSGLQYIRDGKLAEARLAIAPIAFDPHGGGFSAAARQVLELIAKGDAKAALKVRPPTEADQAD